MSRRFRLLVAALVIALACVAAVAFWLHARSTPPAIMEAATPGAPATPEAATTPARPAAKPPAEPARQPVGYDHYRAELKRIRAEREKAAALEANERCIGGERYRKVGSAWERAGNCR